MKLWDKVKRLYFEKFGYTDTLVEMVASSLILKLCASGTSNKQIADALELDIEVVVEEIEKWLYFSGWEEQLACDPLVLWRAFYSQGSVTYKEFDTLYDALMVLPDNVSTVCSRYLAIEKTIMKEWL